MATYGNGTVFKQRGSRFLWLSYYVNGRQIRESSGTAKRSEAAAMLRSRIVNIQEGKPIAYDVRNTTFADLMGMISTDYAINSRKMDLRGPIKHLSESFGNNFARQVTSDRIARHTERRLNEGAAPATINRELATLRRAFNIAMRQGKVVVLPLIDLLKEDNVRKGFFEREQLEAVMRFLPDHLKPVIMTAYLTGWRKQEILSRKLQHLDLENGWLRLEPGETKNGEGRMFPLTRELRQVLTRQMAYNRTWAIEHGQIVPWLFSYQGHGMVDFKTAWHTACKRAGFPNALVHDFRRTAVRNLERAGVSRSAAQAMTGHKTASVYSRYAIQDEVSLKEAALKLEAVQ